MSLVARVRGAQVLSDADLRYLMREAKAAVGPTLLGLFKEYGISLEDNLRFHAVAQRCKNAREGQGLSIKAVAARIRAPQYRIKEIEGGVPLRLDVEVLARYVEFLGLKPWFAAYADRWRRGE